MVVVIDRAFWELLGEMRKVKEISNCDIKPRDWADPNIHSRSFQPPLLIPPRAI
jgi:hypothetical protein